MAASSGGSMPSENLPPRRDAVAQDESEEGTGICGESTLTPGPSPSAGHRHPNAEDTCTGNDESAFAVVEDDEGSHGGSGSAEQRAGSLSGGTGLNFSSSNAVVSTDVVATGRTAALVAEEEDEDDGDEDMHEGDIFHAEEERQAGRGSTSTDDSFVSCAVKDHALFDGGSNEGAGLDESGGESEKDGSIDNDSQIIEQDMANAIMAMLYALAQIKLTYSKDELDRHNPSALLLDASEEAFQLIQTLASGHPAFLKGYNSAQECNQRQRNELEKQQQSQQMMGDSGKDDGGDGEDDGICRDREDGYGESDGESLSPTRLVFKTPSTAQGGNYLLTPTSNIQSDANRKALVALRTQTELKTREYDAKEKKHQKELAAVRAEMDATKAQFEEERKGMEGRIREEIEGARRKHDEERDAQIIDLQEKIAEIAAANDSSDRGLDSGRGSGVDTAGITGLDVESDPKYVALQRQKERLKTQLRKEREKVAELELLEDEKDKSANDEDQASQASLSSSEGDVSNTEDKDEAEERENNGLGLGRELEGGEGGAEDRANRTRMENSDEVTNEAIDSNTMLVVLEGWKRQKWNEIQLASSQGEDASQSQKTIFKNVNDCISTLNSLHSTIESANLGNEWGVLQHRPSDQAKALVEIKKMESNDGELIEIIPGMPGQLGVLKFSLLKAYTHHLELAVAESTAAAIDRASRFLQLFDPHLRVIEAGEIVKAKEIDDLEKKKKILQNEHKLLQADNFGVRTSLLCIVEHGDKTPASNDDGSDEDSDDEDESNQLQIAKAVYEKATALAKTAEAGSLCLGDSVNNVIKHSSSLLAVLSALTFTTLGDLDLEDTKKADIDAFRKFDENCSLSSICDDCISALSNSATTWLTSQKKRRALSCMLALFTTVGQNSNKAPTNKIFKKALTVASRKSAGVVISSDEVTTLSDDENAFKSKSRLKTLTNMVRATATLLLAPHLPALLRQQFRDPVASLDVFPLCMRVSKSSMEDVSRIFWSTGIFKEDAMGDPKKAHLVKYFLNGLASLVKDSKVAGRTSGFDEMHLVASSFSGFLLNLREFVVVHSK